MGLAKPTTAVRFPQSPVPKLPSLADLFRDPTLISRLSTPQLLQLKEQMDALQPKKVQQLVPDNPADFAVKMSRGRWYEARHLRVISRLLTEAASGKRPRVMLSTPPRHGKSELTSYWFPLWFLARNPTKKIILCSYEADFAAHWGRRVRDAINLFGDELGLELDGSTTAANRWQLVSGGGMMTAGAGGPITGKGADLLIIDDPIKNDEEAASEIMREKLWDWWQTTAMTRLEPGGVVVFIGTRWHEDDLLGRLEKAARVEGLDWTVIKFPAIAEAEDPLGRLPGEPLWPERIPLKDLEDRKRGMSPYHFSALYQQNPTPEEGGGVPRRWWKFYKPLPAGFVFDQVIQSWDLAFKDLSTSDYCVGQVWGRKGADCYLLHQVRDHMNMVDVMREIRVMQSRYPQAVAKLIEESANGVAILQVMQHEVRGMIPVKTKGQSKDQRLEAVKPLINAGNVYLPEEIDGSKHPWVWEFVEECAAFPRGTHDDQLDAMTQALKYLQPEGWLDLARQRREEANGAGLPESTEDITKRRFQAWYRKQIKASERRINQQAKALERMILGRTQ